MTNEVDDWFAERQHPLTDAMQLARQLILQADPRVTESIKWKTPTFAYEGNIVSFNPSKKIVSLMFHRGAEIQGDFPRLEGTDVWYGSCASPTSTRSRPPGTNFRP